MAYLDSLRRPFATPRAIALPAPRTAMPRLLFWKLAFSAVAAVVALWLRRR